MGKNRFYSNVGHGVAVLEGLVELVGNLIQNNGNCGLLLGQKAQVTSRDNEIVANREENVCDRTLTPAD